MPAISRAETLSAEASDPGKLGWMVGSPPPAGKIIRFSDPDYFSFPKLRWTVCHFRELMPTVGVSRGLGAPVPLARKIDAGIDAVTFTPLGDRKSTRLNSR